jgi:hypothetical protein
MMMGPLPPDLGGGGVVSAMLALSKRNQGGADYSHPLGGARDFQIK